MTTPVLRLDRVVPPAGADEAALVRALVRSLDLERRSLVAQWEQRRRALERALHDGAQQHLLSLRLALTAPADQARPVAGLVERLDDVIDALGRLASGERPCPAAVDDLVSVLTDAAANSPIEVDVIGPPDIDTDEVVAEALVFVLSELVTNVARHSAAHRCRVEVARRQAELELIVSDHGRGGAVRRRGGGLDGLARRVEALHGELVVTDGEPGTVVVVRVPPNAPLLPGSVEASVHPLPPRGRPERDRLSRLFADPGLGVWFWCALAGFRDEAAQRPADRPAPGRARVRIDAGDELFLLAETERPPSDVLELVSAHFDAVVDAQRWARTAVARQRIETERALLDQRHRATEHMLSERLRSRPTDLLLAARDLLVRSPADAVAARAEASTVIGMATDELRLLVRRLRDLDVDDPESPVPLEVVLGLAAERAHVQCDLAIDELTDHALSGIVERVAEELMFAAGPGAGMRLAVRRRGTAVYLRTRLPRLPEPAAISLIEHAVVGVGGRLGFRPVAEGVRIDVEMPCGS